MYIAHKVDPIQKRKVSRWFYAGKGYATETAAMVARAKTALRDEILTNDVWRRQFELVEEWGNNSHNEYGVSAYHVAIREAYRKKFPCGAEDGWWDRKAHRQWIADHVESQRKEGEPR